MGSSRFEYIYMYLLSFVVLLVIIVSFFALIIITIISKCFVSFLLFQVGSFPQKVVAFLFSFKCNS